MNGKKQMIVLSNNNPHESVRRRLALVGRSTAIALMLAGLTVACSGNEPDTGPTGTQSSKPTAKGKASTESTVQGAREELEGFECSANDKGVWAAKGAITNNSGSSQKYTVNVSVTSKKTSTVIGNAKKTVEVASKKSTEFSMPKVASSTQKDLLCIPLVTKELAK